MPPIIERPGDQDRVRSGWSGQGGERRDRPRRRRCGDPLRPASGPRRPCRNPLPPNAPTATRTIIPPPLFSPGETNPTTSPAVDKTNPTHPRPRPIPSAGRPLRQNKAKLAAAAIMTPPRFTPRPSPLRSIRHRQTNPITQRPTRLTRATLARSGLRVIPTNPTRQPIISPRDRNPSSVSETTPDKIAFLWPAKSPSFQIPPRSYAPVWPSGGPPHANYAVFYNN